MARGKRLGLTLEEIADLANAWGNLDCSTTHDQLLELLDSKLAHVQEEIVELTRFADQLQEVHGASRVAPPRTAGAVISAAARRHSPLTRPPNQQNDGSIASPSAPTPPDDAHSPGPVRRAHPPGCPSSRLGVVA